MQALAPRESLNRKATLAMCFLNASALPRKALERNLFWGLHLGPLLRETLVLERVLERKHKPNVNSSVLGTLPFSPFPTCPRSPR